MNIIKRSGEEKPFDRSKISAAISKANATVEEAERLNPAKIEKITDEVVRFCSTLDRALNVEEIQDLVESKIQQAGAYDVAKKYIKYRFVQELKRRKNTTDQQILSLIESNNEDVKQENSIYVCLFSYGIGMNKYAE